MKDSSHKIGIITTGSEIVTGRISDENSRWLCEKIDDLGLSVAFQISCTDKNLDIDEALRFLSAHCHTIIITGGLGPTQDDLTRKSVASFYKADLEFNLDSWQRLLAFINIPEAEISPMNRQQCYFPIGAEILPNLNGTADGFCCKGEVVTFVLPGPPNENQPMFTQYIYDYLRNKISLQVQTELRWTLLGIPESNLAEMCAETFADLPIDLGFRAHFPTIELKFKLATEKYAALQSVFSDFQNGLKDKLVSTDKLFNLPMKVIEHFSNFNEIQIIDILTQGHLNRELGAALERHGLRSDSISLLTQLEKQPSNFEFVQEAYAELSDSSLLILLAPSGNLNEASILVKTEKMQRVSRFLVPERIAKRGPKFCAAFASYRALLQIDRELSSAPETQ